ncbi:MFS transporter [Pseudooceanicola sp.]|uniref:MFS transporter n=1 Tax=Pseudooceanicola sp. TaxID=1914328 RepID=UPI002605BA28|nr:MFS transporter [Pseudooceanicola sp.]MDF1855896.1 MFS transporter [Pseudooceanicola sp.]
MPLFVCIAALVTAATFGSRPTVSLYAIEIGMSPAEIGVLVALFSLFPLFLTVPAGNFMDRHGTRQVLYLSLVITAIGLTLPWMISGRFMLYASQMLVGCGLTFHMLAAQKTAGDHPDPMVRERRIAVFSQGAALGSFAGPFYTGFVGQHLGFDWAMLLVAPLLLIGLLVMPFVRTSAPNPAVAQAPRQRMSATRVLGYHPYMARAFLISSLVLLGKDFYVAYFPVFADVRGISPAWIGIIIGIHNGGGVIMRVFQIPLVRRFGKSPTIIGSILISGIFFVFLPFTEGLVALTLISLAMGLGLGLGQPLSISTTVNLSPPDKTGEVLGVRLTANRLTQFVMPIGFAAIVTVSGITGAFVFVGLAMSLGSLRLNIPDPKA